jgi:hypothetical protein
MDKFDESIKNSQQTIEPKPDFVDQTMNRINKKSVSKGFRYKLWLPIAAGVAVVLLIIFIALPSSTNDASLNKANSVANSTPQTEKVATAVAPGSDNASLQNDLNGVQTAFNQESADQNGANSTLNDSQQEIAIPTN